MLTGCVIRPGSLPIGGGLQDHGNGKGDEDRRRNAVHATGLVVAEPTEMGTANDEEDEDQRQERNPQCEGALPIHDSPPYRSLGVDWAAADSAGS
jgi:hypothetical protein